MAYPSNDLSPRLFGFIWGRGSNCGEASENIVMTLSLEASPEFEVTPQRNQTALGKKEHMFDRG